MRAEAPRSGHRLISRTVPTHWRDPIAFFAEAAEVESRTLWLRPATGEALVGLGSAVTLVGYGADRFEQVMAEWRALLDDALIDSRGTPGPIALGGFSFDPTRE